MALPRLCRWLYRGSAAALPLAMPHHKGSRRPLLPTTAATTSGGDQAPQRRHRPSPETKQMMMAFVDWKGRPAVIVGSMAWAVLAPGEGWTEVNSSEVAESGRVISARVLSAVFGPS